MWEGMSGRPIVNWLSCVAFASVLAGGSVGLRGETAMSVSAPASGVVNRSGWSLQVETRSAQGGGYTPVTVRLAPVPPAPLLKTRTVRVELRISRYPSMDVTAREIVVPEGSTGTTETIYLTLGKSCWWNELRIESYEDGRHLSELTCRLPPRNPNRAGQVEMQVSLLFLDNDAPLRADRRATIDRLLNSKEPSRIPDFRELAQRLCGNNPGVSGGSSGASESRNAATDARVLLDVNTMEDVDLMPTSELPEDWVALSNFDVTFISWPDLRTLGAGKDGRWPALRTWLAAGNTLCVYGVGGNFAELRNLEKRLALSSLPPASPADEFPGWTAPRASQYGKGLPTFDQQANPYRGVAMLPNGAVVNAAPAGPQNPAPAQPPPPKDLPRFLLRELGMGMVVAMESDQPFPGSPASWDWVFNELGEHRLRPLRRLGVSRFSENPDFGNFLVRNVGQAPVWAFLILITLFMIVIGPLNYYLLRSHRRLYLLFVTVPVSAAVVTLTLLAYAILSDGFHVRSRIRSVTHVDQVGGMSSSWSRQVYFAGLAPRGGLAYPPQAIVHPIDRWGLQEESRNRRVEWSDRQHFLQGYISPRTMSQMLVIDPHATSAGLRIRVAEDGSGACRVRNELGVKLRALLVRDEQGRYYFSEDLADGAELSLTMVELPKYAGVFRQAATDSALGPPLWDDSRSYRRRRWGWWPNQLAASQQTSLMEIMFQRCDVLLREPPRRSYLGIGEEPVETPAGAAASERQQDLNVVIGAW